MNPAIVMGILSGLPTLITAVEKIIESDPVKSIEEVFASFFNHNTPGQPNAPALAPDAAPPAA